MIKVGDKLPGGTLQEFIEVEGNGCSVGPNSFDIHKSTAGKTVAIFGLPGAFTPTCSAKHVPGYVARADELKAAGVDEIWCTSVNDAFVMGAWGRDQKSGGKVRMEGGGEAFPTAASAAHYLGHLNAMKPTLTVAENLSFWRDFCGEPELSVEAALETVGLDGIGLRFLRRRR